MKNILSIIILFTSFFYSFNTFSQDINQQTNTSPQNSSIAKPNWWKKPTGMPADLTKKSKNNSPSMSSAQINTMRTEPIEHFLDFIADKNWQLVSNNIGTASAKYQITLSGKQYELAIIRMNKNIPLDSVLNIWRNKVGLVAQPNNQPVSIKTKKDQSINLITIQGDQKAIMVAYHKQQRYTFFRLFADHGLTPEIESNFRAFLTNLYVKN